MYPLGGLGLTSKRLIKIAGIDATKFINGLVTSRFLPDIVKKKQLTISSVDDAHRDLVKVVDIHKNWGLMHEDIYDPMGNISISRDGINSMFLNSKGRVVTDTFIYASPFAGPESVLEETPSYLVEVDAGVHSKVMSLLRLHKLGAKVTVTPEDLHSYYYYHDSPEFDQWLDDIQMEYFANVDPIQALEKANSFIRSGIFAQDAVQFISGVAIDNRVPNFGIKVVTSQPVDRLFSDAFVFDQSEVSEVDITRRRYVNGLFEVADAAKGTSILPFETNLDYTNGLSLEKGCYVGQELTIRTFNNGIIRKRVVPVQFHPMGEENPSPVPVLEVDSEVAAQVANIGEVDVLPLVEPEEEQPLAASPFGGSKPVRKRKTSSGKILSVQDNLGFALMNLADMDKSGEFKVDVDNKAVAVTAFRPVWWPEEE